MKIAEIDINKSILTKINSTELTERNIELYIKRDDLIHPEISGNKWRKLKYNIDLCVTNKQDGIITFGGAYSNHLVATAAACATIKMKSIGIVRGDELNSNSNETLKKCTGYDMELVFVSREIYKRRYEKSYHEYLHSIYPNCHLVEEGGANYYGMIGCQEIVKELALDFDAIFVAQGTTTTSCGLAMGLNNEQKLYVVPALKGFDSHSEMKQLFRRSGFEADFIDEMLMKTVVLDDFHFGGYGKYNSELLEFIQDVYSTHQLKLDPIYTGKAFFAMMEQIKNGKLDNSTIVFIHTGGLQGAQSVMNKSKFNFWKEN